MSELIYEPRVILEHANRLNRRADSMGLTSAVIGAVIGGFFGAVPLTSLGDSWPIPHQFGFGTLLGGLLIGALAGYVIGDARAFGYRLQAQSSLCQLHLERNTAALLADTHTPVTKLPSAPVFAYVEPEVETELEHEPAPVVEVPLPRYLTPDPELGKDEPESQPESPSFVNARISAYLEPAPEPEPESEPEPIVAALVPEYVEPEPEPDSEPEPAPLVEVPALSPGLADEPQPDLDSMSLDEIAELAKTGLI